MGKHIRRWDNLYKIDIILEYARKSQEEFILFMDGADAIITDDPQLLIDRFLLFPGAEIVYNAEKGSWPKRPDAENFEKQHYQGGFPYLNSGVFIGRRLAVIRFYEECKALLEEAFYLDDQDVIRRHHQAWFPKVQMDSEGLMFCCLFGLEQGDPGYDAVGQISGWEKAVWLTGRRLDQKRQQIACRFREVFDKHWNLDL